MAAKSIIKAAAVQLKPVLNDGLATTEKICDCIRTASFQGADLIVFPETCVPNYPYFSFIVPPVLSGSLHLKLYEQAVSVPGPLTDFVSSTSRHFQMVVVLGVNQSDGRTLYNTQLAFTVNHQSFLMRPNSTPTYP